MDELDRKKNVGKSGFDSAVIPSQAIIPSDIPNNHSRAIDVCQVPIAIHGNCRIVTPFLIGGEESTALSRSNR